MKGEKWQKDLSAYRNINTSFIIEGNVHDLQPWVYEEDDCCEPIKLSEYLNRYLVECGYDSVIFYNRVDGFYNPYAMEMVDTFYREIGSDARRNKSIDFATESIRKCLSGNLRPTAIIIDFANTIATSPDNLSDEEIECYTKLMLATKNPIQAISTRDRKPLTNLLFLIVEKVNDIPAWFYLNNPYVRTLTIPRPEKEIRSSVIDARIDFVEGVNDVSQETRKKILEEFVSLTDGMTLVDILGVCSLCGVKGYSIHQINEAINMFRYGETESHWDKIDLEKVRNADKYFSRRVKGQQKAVEKATSILSRACLGLSGIQGGAISKPKGVLFFAGPTGTGKTELAKTIAEFIFGDEGFVTRFDMSEYQQPHSDQKLLGAPPGYVGYSDGGQLTNAVKNKPFCVLLFDEIDKAHPSIMDKFLQILEDGRITDSTGETVYFTEALIIFTSNLGMVGTDSNTGLRFQTITPDMSYEQVESTLISTIKDYFKYTIQRPELLNRIGDNFVVFDFIREEAAQDILDIKLKTIIDRMEKQKGIKLIIDSTFREFLLDKAKANLENGGRGIGNVVETYFVNPLSNIIVKEIKNENCSIHISGVDEEGNIVYSIE